MANFLHNLALRSIAPQTLLRPPMAYRFEGVRRADPVSAPEAYERAEEVNREAAQQQPQAIRFTPTGDSAPVVPDRLPFSSPHTLVTPPAAAAPPSGEAPRAATPVPAPLVPEVAPPSSPVRRAPSRLQLPETLPPEIATEHPQLRASASPTRPPLRDAPQESRNDSEAADLPSPQILQPLETRILVEERAAHGSAPSEASTPPTPLPILQPPPTMPPAVSAPGARTQEAGASAAASPRSEPTIHVTIGRIEIRATKEPGRTERPGAERKPGHDLQDYLNRRGGAER